MPASTRGESRCFSTSPSAAPISCSPYPTRIRVQWGVVLGCGAWLSARNLSEENFGCWRKMNSDGNCSCRRSAKGGAGR